MGPALRRRSKLDWSPDSVGRRELHGRGRDATGGSVYTWHKIMGAADFSPGRRKSPHRSQPIRYRATQAWRQPRASASFDGHNCAPARTAISGIEYRLGRGDERVLRLDCAGTNPTVYAHALCSGWLRAVDLLRERREPVAGAGFGAAPGAGDSRRDGRESLARDAAIADRKPVALDARRVGRIVACVLVYKAHQGQHSAQYSASE